MKADLLKIINYHGLDFQVKYWFTEIYELVQAIEKDDGSEESRQHIKSELADNYNFLGQFKEFYGITDDEMIKEQEFKNKRHLKEIEQGKWKNDNNKDN